MHVRKKRRSMNVNTNRLQLINITDIFISPAEDLYVNHFFIFGFNYTKRLAIQLSCDGLLHDRPSRIDPIKIEAIGYQVHPVLHLPTAGMCARVT